MKYLSRTQVLATIDELNQYLNGNVTKTSIQITLEDCIEAVSHDYVEDKDNTPAIDRMYNSDAWVKAQQDSL